MGDNKNDQDLEMVEVHKVWGPAETEVIKTLLESHGIFSMTRGHVLQSVLPMTTDGMGEIKILVPKKFAARAKKLIHDAIDNNK